MRTLLLLSLSFSACDRGLTEVRSPPEAEPDFLGAYSGVYRGIDTGDDAVGRTVVIQLGRKIAMSPFYLVDGEPRLSRFASVADVPDVVTEPVESESVVVLGATETDMWPSGVTCDPTENDYWASVAEANLFQEVSQRVGQCQMSPGTCHSVCYMPSIFAPEDGILGACVGDGTLCSYPITVYGRVGRDVVELLFDQNTVAPEPEFERLSCTEPNGDGWQRCTPYQAGCEGWASCKFLDKLCDFDSRVAGVYQAELSLDGTPSRSVDLAVAIANNMPAIIVFLSDEELGDRLLIGALDPATMAFQAHDGKTPSDAGWAIRNGREPDIEFSGTIVEDAAAGRVRFEDGSWTESRNAGADETVYTLTASRLSGVTPGAVCQSMKYCESPPLRCPLGNSVQIRGSSLQVDSHITDDGCVTSECQRVLTESSLCEPLPSCGGVDVGDRVYEQYDLWLSPPECPADNSNCRDEERESCARFVCHDDAYGAATAANWYQVDEDCSGTMVLRHEGQFGLRFDCEQSGAICPSFAPSCPMGTSQEIETALIPEIDDDGCVSWRCEQFFTPSEICSDVTPPTCAADELLQPTIRIVDGDADCIELACQPGCDTSDCNNCGLCGPFDVNGCAGGSIKVSEDCGGCIRTACENPACPYEPVVCPLGDAGYLATRLIPQASAEGCVRFSCEQYYGPGDLCGDVLASCPSGDVLVPGWRESESCVEYSCVPEAGGEIDPYICADTVRVRYENNKVYLDCEPAVCQLNAVDCGVDLQGLAQSLEPHLDTIGCLSLTCEQYYDPPAHLCSDSPLPSALACTGGDVVTLQYRSVDVCLEYVCAPSCTTSCVDCGGSTCADPTFPDSCGAGDVIGVWPECGDCIYVQCYPL